MKPRATQNYKLLSGLMVLFSFISVYLFHSTYHIVSLIAVVGTSCGVLHWHSKHHPWQVKGSSHCYSPLWSLRKHQSERYSHVPLLTTCLIMKKHGSKNGHVVGSVCLAHECWSLGFSIMSCEKRTDPRSAAQCYISVKQQGWCCSDWYEQTVQSNRIHIGKTSNAVQRVHVSNNMLVNT